MLVVSKDKVFTTQNGHTDLLTDGQQMNSTDCIDHTTCILLICYTAH